MTRLPARRNGAALAVAPGALKPGQRPLWVRVGTEISEPWWTPALPTTFEPVGQSRYGNAYGNVAALDFPPSTWECTVTLRYLVGGPEPDYMCILGVLDGALVVPPGAKIHFSRHAISVMFN